jgi:putative cell wall-binding protein
MLRRRSTTLLAAFAVLAATAAGTVAAAPANAASNPCPNHGPIKLTPGPNGIAPFDVTIDLSNITVDPAHGCVASLDYGDGSPPDQPTDNAKTWTHHYTLARTYEIQLLQTWQLGYNAITTTVFAQTAAGKAGVGRLSGANRIATAAAISQNQWSAPGSSALGQADAVVLARGDKFPDALAGAPLAAYKMGPLLLTDPTYLDAASDAEITRILPKGKTVYILGGPAAMSTVIDAKLTGEGYKIQRLFGDDRFQTALQIAKVGLNDPPKVVVATGRDFADALTAGPLAAGPLSTRQRRSC